MNTSFAKPLFTITDLENKPSTRWNYQKGSKKHTIRFGIVWTADDEETQKKLRILSPNSKPYKEVIRNLIDYDSAGYDSLKKQLEILDPNSKEYKELSSELIKNGYKGLEQNSKIEQYGLSTKTESPNGGCKYEFLGSEENDSAQRDLQNKKIDAIATVYPQDNPYPSGYNTSNSGRESLQAVGTGTQTADPDALRANFLVRSNIINQTSLPQNHLKATVTLAYNQQSSQSKSETESDSTSKSQELRNLSPSLDLREEGGSPIGKELLECKDVGSESLQFGASPE